MKRLVRDDKANLHNTFSPSHAPVLHVDQNEVFEVETIDCFNGTVTPENPSVHPPYEMLNLVTGPVYVKDAEVGDVLAVTLCDIQPQGVGVSRFGCCCGQLAQHVSIKEGTGDDTRFFDYDAKHHTVTVRELDCTHNNHRKSPLVFPASPMVGVVGVAPPGDASIAIKTIPAGKHGGNMDDRMHQKGSIIYIRVNQPGALLSVGDCHSSMEDGEICGTGIEINSVIKLSCSVIKQQSVLPSWSNPTFKWKESSLFQSITDHPPFSFQFPITETETHYYTHGVTVEDIPAATKVACEEAARLLVGQWGFTPEDAFVFLSVKGNLGLCQAVHPDKGTQIARMEIPKIDACPRPFRCLSNETKISNLS